jgi:hypothetical protein
MYEDPMLYYAQAMTLCELGAPRIQKPFEGGPAS